MGRNTNIGARVEASFSPAPLPTELTLVEAFENQSVGGSGMQTVLRHRLDPGSGAQAIGDGVEILHQGDNSVGGPFSYSAYRTTFDAVISGSELATVSIAVADGAGGERVVFTGGGGGLAGVGIATPDGAWHIHEASAGAATATATGNTLVVESDGNMGMSFLAPATASQNIFFGRPGLEVQGAISYNHNNDSLAIHANATLALTIDSSGIVHIGGTTTTSNWNPTAYLNIEGAIPAITLRDTTASADDWTFANNNGSLWITNDTNNTSDLVINDSGNVGIGESNPSTFPLHVKSANAGSGVAQLEITSASHYAGLTLKTPTTIWNIAHPGSSVSASNQLYFHDGSSYVMTIVSGGKVGIGTTSPNFALQVNAGASQVVSEFYGTTASSFLSIASSSEAISNNTGIAFSAYPGGVLGSYCSTAFIQSYVVQSSPTLKGNLIFVTNSGDQTYEAMRIDENQNVGIGTNAPTSPGGIDKFLHIYSNTHAGLILEDTSHSPWTMWTQNGELMYSYSSTEYMKLQAGGHLHTRDFGTYEVGTSVGATHNIQIYPQAKRAVYVWILHCSVGGGNQSAPYDEMHQASWHGFLWRDITETGYTEFHSPGGDGVSFGDRSIGIGSPSAASSYVNLQATVGSNTTGVLKIMWMGYLEKLAIDSSTVYTTPT